MKLSVFDKKQAREPEVFAWLEPTPNDGVRVVLVDATGNKINAGNVLELAPGPDGKLVIKRYLDANPLYVERDGLFIKMATV
jgi:hypothetical protein